ncbi:MAG: AsmA family protein [Candidatus Omnitrophica bacterium]|nr:AsmA family protein [Candidatus Omnitrophota bacterium]MBU4479319.1 AsmA family protein [Candidatus Omnitrophota bacterium]MCG2704241.1 AsmA family protein [Candidatus Omnitrophota bacterium]
MFKRIGIGILVILLVLFIIFAAAKNIIVKTAITAGVKTITGLRLDIESMNIGVLKTLVGIKGLKLYNPPQFEDALMVDLPEIYVDYDLKAFFDKKIHLEEVRLDLKEFIVVKNKDGVLNLDSLKAVQTAHQPQQQQARKSPLPAEKKEKMPEMKIDKLRLKIGKVVFKDYSKGAAPEVKEFNVNIDESFENITDPQALIRIILVKALSNKDLLKLLNFDLGSIANGLTGTVKDAGTIIQDITGNTLDLGKGVGATAVNAASQGLKKTTDKIKKLFPLN